MADVVVDGVFIASIFIVLLACFRGVGTGASGVAVITAAVALAFNLHTFPTPCIILSANAYLGVCRLTIDFASYINLFACCFLDCKYQRVFSIHKYIYIVAYAACVAILWWWPGGRLAPRSPPRTLRQLWQLACQDLNEADPDPPAEAQAFLASLGPPTPTSAVTVARVPPQVASHAAAHCRCGESPEHVAWAARAPINGPEPERLSLLSPVWRGQVAAFYNLCRRELGYSTGIPEVWDDPTPVVATPQKKLRRGEAATATRRSRC